VRGGRRKHLDAAGMAALAAAFQTANFFDLKEKCDRHWTDDSTAYVHYSDGVRTRVIRDYHGCEDAPPALRKLEDEIDRIVDSTAWVQGKGAKMGTARWSDLGAYEPQSFP
jgi:hypothetical protein